MADFVFGDFSEQETEKFFGHDKQCVKVNEPEFPWATDDCMSTAIEFGFDVPQVLSPAGGAGVSYPTYGGAGGGHSSCNGSCSHQESNGSALTSPPYSSKSSSIENLKMMKSSSSSHNRRNSDRKLKKKRPPGYYREEYQQMLEPATLQQQQQQQQQLNGEDDDETTPIQVRSGGHLTTTNNEQTPQLEQNSTESNLLLLSDDARYYACNQWVDSTIKHRQLDGDDDQLSSKQSINDEDELDAESHGTTTDTDNDNDLLQSTSTTRPSYPVNIIPSSHHPSHQKSLTNHHQPQPQHPSSHLSTATTTNSNNNDLAVYSTSVASGASVETLKASNNLAPVDQQLSPSVSPAKQQQQQQQQPIGESKSKPSSWADLFRSQAADAAAAAAAAASAPPPPPPPPPPAAASPAPASPVKKPQATSSTAQPSSPSTTSSLARSLSGTQISTPPPQQNGGNTPRTSTSGGGNAFYARNNYHVYNSSGSESRSLDDYFTKCEVRPSAMAIKPRGLMNKSNYCYVNATLQALLACPAFFNVMKYIPFNEDPIDHNVPCLKAVHAFVNQFEKMDRSKNAAGNNHKDIVCGSAFDAVDILQEIARLRRVPLDIVKTKQEDAHELLCQLLNELHDEVCSILYKQPSSEESPSITTVGTQVAGITTNGEEKAEDWLQVGKRNRTHVLRTSEIRKSLIADIFSGKFRSTVHTAGNQKSVVHEPFFTLSLDIKDSKINSLDDALLRFCEQSVLSDYVDSKTRQNVHTNKTMLIEQLPPILIIHLKCFLYDETDGTKKINKPLNYTVNLTLPKSILTEQARKQYHERYKLFAVEYHLGERASNGHYITDVFHPGLQGWIRYDDANTHVVTSSQVMNSTADKLTPYLLFYRRGE